MKIRQKLVSGYLLVAIMIAGVGFFGIFVTRKISNEFKDVAKQAIPVIETLKDLKFAGLRIVSSTSEFILIQSEKASQENAAVSNESQSAEEESLIQSGKNSYEEAFAQYERLNRQFYPAEKEFLESIKQKGQELIESSSALLDLKKQGISGPRALEAKEQFEKSERSFLETTDRAIEHKNNEIKERKQRVNHLFVFVTRGVIASTVFVISIAVLIGVIYAHVFSKPVFQLRDAALEIGKGRLETQVKIKSGDEFAILGKAFNEMAFNLKNAHDSLVQEMEKRKKLETVALQSEKMVAIGQLAGGVAHEINNPLGVILGFAQNVVKRITPGDPLEMPLKSIEREAIRCKNLVQDLLTFSRVGKSEKELLDLQETIESALALILAQSKVKNVELVKEFEEVPKMNANRTQIQQIIVNLCNNAIDAMPNGGRLAIRVEKTKIDGAGGVEIRVQDTGQGIPKEIQSKIFNPFFTTKEMGRGTGLGLSLVYEIIQKHNGQISVNSEVGKGTVFHVLLPLNS